MVLGNLMDRDHMVLINIQLLIQNFNPLLFFPFTLTKFTNMSRLIDKRTYHIIE